MTINVLEGHFREKASEKSVYQSDISSYLRYSTKTNPVVTVN